LAVLLIVAHGTHRWWFTVLVQTLFGYVPESFSEVTSGLAWVMIGWIVLSLAGGVGLALIGEGSLVRDCYRWEREDAERQRLWEIRDRLWLESLSPEFLEGILVQRRESAELEARARALLKAERQAQQDGHERGGEPG
jgi:hypothetical protein